MIDSLAIGGRGVGRVDGRPWFVAGAIPGDHVVARPTRDRGRWVEATVEKFVARSPSRREAPCPLQGGCGGCPWMVLDEVEQLAWKRRLVEDALVRIGRFRDVHVEDTVPSPVALAYRNKVELSFGRDRSGRRVLGFHGPAGARGLQDVDRCLLLDDAGNRVVASARSFFIEGPGATDDLLDSGTEPARLVIRSSAAAGGYLVIVRTVAGPFRTGRLFAAAMMDAHEAVTGVVRVTATPGRRGGAQVDALAGAAWVDEQVAGLRFRVPAATFFQVNSSAAALLVERVREAATPAREVVELYGGVGVIGSVLARQGARVRVVEADLAAVKAGRDAAARNGLTGIRFVRADASVGLAALSARRPRPDVVVADPPRTGLGHGVAARIASLGPPRVVLVGCDPATFARDCAVLAARGYRLDRVTPLDLFPQTAHVESVGLLVR